MRVWCLDPATNGDGLRYQRNNVLTLTTAFLSAYAAPPAWAEIKPVPLVQRTLSGQGFDAGEADGIWGQKSIGALKAFQRSRGLNPSGVIDPPSIKELFPSTGTASDASRPALAPAKPVAPTQATDAQAQIAPSNGFNSSPRDKGSGFGTFIGFFLLFIVLGGVFMRPKRRVGKGSKHSRRR